MRYEKEILNLFKEKYVIENCDDLHVITLEDIIEYDLSDIRWQPDFLVKYSNSFFAFDYALEYGPNSFILSSIQKVSERIKNFQMFFVVQNQNTMDIVSKTCYEKKYGLIYVENANARIIMKPDILVELKDQISKHSDDKHVLKIPKYLLKGISELKNIDPTYRDLLKKFAFNYLEISQNRSQESELIDSTIKSLLDLKYIGKVQTSFQILKKFEDLIAVTRDHYYHSFQIFLLGIIIIDSFYEQFNNYIYECFPERKQYSIEFTWLLTSIFHDIGYAMQHLNTLIKTITDSDELEIDIVDIWKDARYKKNAAQYISLFKYLLKSEISEDWRGDIFGKTEEEMFDIITDTCKNGHGLHSSFRFLVEAYDVISRIDDDVVKNFLVKHVYIASISISLHDWRYRNKIKEKIVEKLDMKRFPFAILLMYLDSLHEDRRNNEAEENYEDTILDIKISEDSVELDLNLKYILKCGKLTQMSLESKSISDFVTFDNFKLIYPDWLVQQE